MDLLDAEDRARQSPGFRIPSLAVRSSIPVGAYAKLVFMDRDNCPSGERMWVRVARRNQDGSYEGALDNDPVCVRTIRGGEAVLFSPRHVIDVIGEEQVSRITSTAGRASWIGLGVGVAAIFLWKILSR